MVDDDERDAERPAAAATETDPATTTDTAIEAAPRQIFLSRFFRATRALQALVAADLAELHGLELRDFMVLTSISKGFRHPSAIARRLHANKFTISRIVQKLIDLGLINREIDADDSRKVLLSATDRGLELRVAAIASLQSRMGPMFDALGDERLDQLVDGLDQVIEQLGAPAEEKA